MSKPIYLAIASPNGGVGKTTLTVLAASILHYHRGCDVAVVDGNHPVYTIARLRQQESEELNHQRLMCLKQRTSYTPYPIICTPVREALSRVEQHCVENHPRCILFDLPALMRTEGTVELLSTMDAVLFPVTGSPMDMEAVRHFIDILGEQILTMGKGNIRELYLLRNMIQAWEREDADERCRTLADETSVRLMQTSLSHSRLYRPLLSERRRGVCTLFPPHGGKLTRLCDQLGNELHEILQRLCTE
ncbi:ParA family protein [Porphyromonas gulae]|uniref:Conjugal transfer protein TraA n=1 Tax=Porphyromonas gulae TaxID=111105 RepID=A0A0A2F598_9PORP|nr:ParA family protein [Porphyromonas gulae]KGN85215.1 conjugal transfer protein TraA [Porphyromonas gulae]